MKIVIVSDTHDFHHLYELFGLPQGDVLIHGGDITRRGKIEEVERFNKWLGTLNYKHILVIAGNHDWCFQREAEKARAALTNGTYLEDSGVTIDGVKFWGSPWQPEFHNWAFNLARGAALAEKWALIPGDTEILITHGPPHGFGDRVHSGELVGCRELLKRVEELAPKAHIFGHIHEDYGVFSNERTTFINASFLDGEFDPGNAPIVMTLESGELKVETELPENDELEPSNGVYSVKLVERLACPVMSRCFQVAFEDLTAQLGEVLPAVYDLVMDSDIRPAGPPFCRYHGMADGVFDVEVGLPVTETTDRGGEIRGRELPGGELAMTTHIGHYKELGLAHSALKSWAKEQGREASGGSWELYLTDPAKVKDPERWRTKLFLPLK
jgi:Icc-related predicted phosphoesterase/effector-binding domain-containing protein